MFFKPTMILLALVVLAIAGLVVYDRTSDCDPGPVTRGVKDLLDERYVTRCGR